MEHDWGDIRSELQKGLPRGQFDLWVATIECLGLKEGRLVLGCRSRFHGEWLRANVERRILDLARKRLPGVTGVAYEVLPEMAGEAAPEDPIVEGPRQIAFRDVIPPAPAFNPRFTFEEFVVGQGNRFAHAAAMNMATGAQFYNQAMYLVSDTGLGKTHLAQAVGNHLRASSPATRVRCLTAEQFANEMIAALKTDRIEAFKHKFRAGCDMLVMEKVEFLGGKEKIQSEFIYTLDELMDRGKKIICTGAMPPGDIPRLSAALRSRLGGVLVAPIERPDFATRMNIVLRKARNEDVAFPREVAEFVAERVSGDVRRIESCVVGIIAKSNILQVPVTLHLADEVTRTMLDSLPRLSVERILEVVCGAFQVTPEDLRSPSRRREVTFARQVGMYLAREYTSQPLAAIGRAFGRSHSVVVYSVNRLKKELLAKNGKVSRHIEYVSRRIETSCLRA